MKKSYKINYSLFIKPSETHFGKPIDECNCGECPDFICKKDSFIINDGEEYYCRIIGKLIKVFDSETASHCFQSWFLEGDTNKRLEDNFNEIIPIKQREFYESDFIEISEDEFLSGFNDLEMEITSVSNFKKNDISNITKSKNRKK